MDARLMPSSRRVRASHLNWDRLWAQGDVGRILFCVILGLLAIGLITWAAFDDVFEPPTINITGPR